MMVMMVRIGAPRTRVPYREETRRDPKAIVLKDSFVQKKRCVLFEHGSPYLHSKPSVFGVIAHAS